MKKVGLVSLALMVFHFCAVAQIVTDGSFKLALADHRGQLSWSADGFKMVQSSAEPGGREIGIRGTDESGRLTFLGFLLQVPEKAPLTSAKCLAGAVETMRKSNPKLKILETTERTSPGTLPISMVRYSSQGGEGKMVYSVRGFIATGDICGDLGVYSNSPITANDAIPKKIFASYRLDENYSPQFSDVFLYAQILYRSQMYKAAGPIFEAALAKVRENPGPATKMMMDTKTATRVVTDQAGMAYGMAGDIPKARALFENAIAADPDYPMYYYNLACADAEEKNLAGARNYLQQAFARKANVISGESMPNPTEDDSFLPYRDNKEFWTFLQSLQP